ncbi:hypothetical protein Bhyg_02948 [Pseudolycoriella hygida]|uniref:Uncharacterized protein n=1 Tax=Pseudolycoriella hygida TaxID=35572 RepID=A0A9Q0S924_9DIPT|nr:hypothetical protein Bhyg_02948 [Pseudolycoriella hygida]
MTEYENLISTPNNLAFVCRGIFNKFHGAATLSSHVHLILPKASTFPKVLVQRYTQRFSQLKMSQILTSEEVEDTLGKKMAVYIAISHEHQCQHQKYRKRD